MANTQVLDMDNIQSIKAIGAEFTDEIATSIRKGCAGLEDAAAQLNIPNFTKEVQQLSAASEQLNKMAVVIGENCELIYNHYSKAAEGLQ